LAEQAFAIFGSGCGTNAAARLVSVGARTLMRQIRNLNHNIFRKKMKPEQWFTRKDSFVRPKISTGSAAGVRKTLKPDVRER
jgi:hypothetical protein